MSDPHTSPAPQGADPWAQIHATYYALMLYGNTGEASQRRVYLAADVDQARQQMQGEINRLRAERGDWDTIIEHHRAMALRFAEACDEAKHENRALKAEVARLTAARAALKPFLMHRVNCASWTGRAGWRSGDSATCTCGLAALLAAEAQGQ